MNIFYTRDIVGNIAILDKIESHHCSKVLRLKPGEKVSVVDGSGGYFDGVLTITDPNACQIDISHSYYEFEKRPFNLHIAIAPTKNIDRFEWFLEKATEIGVDEITPLICEHSERRIIRDDRLEKVLVSAMKQSLKAYLPVLNPVVSFEKFVDSVNVSDKLIAHCFNWERQELIKIKPFGREFSVLIGPEGDFSEKEINYALEKQFIPVTMGKSRLRTETAGVAACQIISDLIAIQ